METNFYLFAVVLFTGTMSQCMGTDINQCIQVVGVYYDPVSNMGYYKIRNSWGTDWGEDGFIRLGHGNNVCDITYNPGYTDPVDCC
jgi:cathepsin H